MDEALALAGRITANAPLAVQAAKKITERALTDTDDQLWAASAASMKELSKTEDYKEGPRAFIEKREPVWQAK